MLETQGPCAYIQPRDSQLCMVIMERQGEPLFKIQDIFTPFASKLDILSIRKMKEGPWGGSLKM